MESGKWKVEGGRWKVEGGRWKVEGGLGHGQGVVLAEAVSGDIELTGLQPGTKYSLRARCVSSGGTGPWSAYVTIFAFNPDYQKPEKESSLPLRAPLRMNSPCLFRPGMPEGQTQV